MIIAYTVLVTLLIVLILLIGTYIGLCLAEKIFKSYYEEEE